MNTDQYYNPVKIVFGKKAIAGIAGYAKEYSISDKILLLTGKNSMRRQGYMQITANRLRNEGFDVEVGEGINPQPEVEDIDTTVKQLRKKEHGLIIGLGGGSVMDYAKSVAILINNKGSAFEYMNKLSHFTEPSVPLIQIPTTCGTGSEVTKWATLWHKGKKYSLSDDMMYAQLAVVDPKLIMQLPKHLVASTGLDALCHSVEAYWAKKHNPISDMYALRAIELINENLTPAMMRPSRYEFRSNMMLASLFAGLAFSNTSTTAVHSVSYPLSGYHNIPHGLACGLLLGKFMKYNSDPHQNRSETPKRIKRITTTVGCSCVDDVIAEIQEILRLARLPKTLEEAGIKPEDYENIVNNAFTKGRMDNNPRVVTKERLIDLLRK